MSACHACGWVSHSTHNTHTLHPNPRHNSKECGCFGVRATRLINAMKGVNPNLAFSINPERAPKAS